MRNTISITQWFGFVEVIGATCSMFLGTWVTTMFLVIGIVDPIWADKSVWAVWCIVTGLFIGGMTLLAHRKYQQKRLNKLVKYFRVLLSQMQFSDSREEPYYWYEFSPVRFLMSLWDAIAFALGVPIVILALLASGVVVLMEIGGNIREGLMLLGSMIRYS